MRASHESKGGETAEEVPTVTANDVPGYRVEEIFGEVAGLTVRPRNVRTQIGAGLKSFVGGELKGLTKQLVDSRREAGERMIEGTQAVGANVILAMLFVGAGYQEFVAYGAAARIRRA